jgi:hypothetical protein
MNSITRTLGGAWLLAGFAAVLVACGDDPGGNTTTAAAKTSGVTTITLSRPFESTSFVYAGDSRLFKPKEAMVVSVTNIATDKSGKGVDLGPITHTDLNGASGSTNPSGPNCPQYITLRPDLSTTAFNHTLVAGTWSAEVACISNSFLKDIIYVKVAWRKP